MTARYHINVFWSDEDASWIADVPDLAPCSAHGESASEAVAEVQGAIEGKIAAMRAHGDRIPEPRYRPTRAA